VTSRVWKECCREAREQVEVGTGSDTRGKSKARPSDSGPCGANVSDHSVHTSNPARACHEKHNK